MGDVVCNATDAHVTICLCFLVFCGLLFLVDRLVLSSAFPLFLLDHRTPISLIHSNKYIYIFPSEKQCSLIKAIMDQRNFGTYFFAGGEWWLDLFFDILGFRAESKLCIYEAIVSWPHPILTTIKHLYIVPYLLLVLFKSLRRDTWITLYSSEIPWYKMSLVLRALIYTVSYAFSLTVGHT